MQDTQESKTTATEETPMEETTENKDTVEEGAQDHAAKEGEGEGEDGAAMGKSNQVTTMRGRQDGEQSTIPQTLNWERTDRNPPTPLPGTKCDLGSRSR